MVSQKSKIDEAVSQIRKKVGTKPEFAIILGSGLGGLVREIQDKVVIPYDHIPHFVKSTAIGHKGELVFGKIGQRDVVAMEGRLHYYEGYSMQEVTFPIRVMRFLGAGILIVSNASGGLNPLFERGDIMLIDDHINFMGTNPLIGPNEEQIGPRFPDMSEPYDKKLIKHAEEVALRLGIKIKRGVYTGLTGPCFETRAEYRFLRAIGTDALGMSTVPEVIVGVHCGFRILGVSIITDLCFPDALKPLTAEEVIEIANKAEPVMTALIKEFITTYKD
jgi:purine-nucleoside phosphorylase